MWGGETAGKGGMGNCGFSVMYVRRILKNRVFYLVSLSLDLSMGFGIHWLD